MRFLLKSALAASFLCAPFVAQPIQVNSPKSSDISLQKNGPGPEIHPQREQAISVLNKLFETVKEFGDDKIRIEAQAQIADALWPYERENARRQFTEAFRSIERIESEERSDLFYSDQKSSLRLSLLNLLAERDTDLAEKLVNSIPESQSKTDRTAPAKTEDGKGKLYLYLAMKLIPSDPKRAADLITKVFNSGFSMELIIALKSLGGKEPETADKLLSRAFSEIQPDPQTPMMDLFTIGAYFIADNEKPESGAASQRKDDSSAAADEIKPVLVNPLLNFAYKAITIESANERSRTSSGNNQDRMLMFDMIDSGIVGWLLPLFERHQPERAAFIQSRLDHIDNVIPPTVHQSLKTPRPTTVKELLDEAQATKDSFRKDDLYADAARKAEESGDFDQAIAITEKLGNKSMGMNVAIIRQSAAIKAGDKGDIDAVYRYAKEIPDPFDQAWTLCRVAEKLIEMRKPQQANELIAEAKKIIAPSGPTSRKVSALLNIAVVATRSDLAGAFEVVNTAIATINQIHSANSGSNGMALIEDSRTFEKSLGRLAGADFERAMKMALAISQSDISALAQLAVCRGILAPPKKERSQ